MRECNRKSTMKNLGKPCDCETFHKHRWVCSEKYGKCKDQGKKIVVSKQKGQ
jgi:hypothetical protein